MQQHTGPFRVVSIYDPAIDLESTNLVEYVRTRDVGALKFYDGARPTVFHARVMTLSERRAARSCATDADRYEHAFKTCLQRVDDLVYENTGERRSWVRAGDDGAKQRPIDDASLEQHFAESDIQEIGSVIWARSFFSRAAPLHCPPLDTSLLALRGRTPHPAALTRDTSSSAQSSEEAKAAPPETP